MNRANYITVTEFQEFNPELNFTGYSATTLSGMITRASANCDNYIGYTLPYETITREQKEGMVSSDGDLVVFGSKRPIRAVSEIRLKLGSTIIDVTLTDGNGNERYDITERGDRITIPYQDIALTGTFTINDFALLRGRTFFTQMTYEAGYQEIPMDIKDAVNLFAKDIFIRQANPMDLQSVNQGAINMNFRTRTDGKSDFIVDAENKLNEYKKYTA